MAFTLSNSHLHFTLDPATSTWSLFTQTSETPSIEGARLNGLFRFSDLNWPHLGGLQSWQWRGWLDNADISTRTQDSEAHGKLTQLVARVHSGIDSLAITAEFSLPQAHPFLLIRLRVQNIGRKPFKVSRLNPLFVGPLHHTGSVRLTTTSAPLTFFSNGWQSWSFAGALTANRTQPGTWLTPVQGPVIHNPATPMIEVRGQFSSDMFGVLACPSQRAAIVVGFISQTEQFGSVDVVAKAESPSLRLRAQCDEVTLPPGGELVTDPAYVQLLADYGQEPLGEYAEAVARENKARVPKDTPAGWCSWYHYFNKVTEADMRANLDRVAADRDQLPLNLVQLDDGFEANVGDWFETNAKFPSGLRALSDSIRANGFTPGLWLAPFIARPEARIVSDHPEWFIKGVGGLPANAGFVFDKFSRGLDITHPGAQEHVRKLISMAVNDWGYPYLKLDFLYATALRGKRYDSTRTRAQAMRLGLELIRNVAGPDTFLLGCGCPLGSAVGLVDAMRISADVDVQWRPRYQVSLPFHHEPGMPSARNAIRNTLARAPLHRRWWLNDPDCLVVREGTALTLEEMTALVSVIALSGGLFLISDDLTTLAPDRRKYVEPLLPVIGKSAVALDWLEREMPETLELPLSGAAGDWKVFGIFNWGEKRADRSLPIESDSHLFDFWTQTYQRAAQPLSLPSLPPHSGRLFAVRPVQTGPQYVGSSLHFSQGYEVTDWQGTNGGVQFVLTLNRVTDGFITLSLPITDSTPVIRQPNAVATPGIRLADGVYRFPVSVSKQARLTVEW